MRPFLLLLQILKYHIVPGGALTAADLTKAMSAGAINLKTAQGQNVVAAATAAAAKAGKIDGPALPLATAGAVAGAAVAGVKPAAKPEAEVTDAAATTEPATAAVEKPAATPAAKPEAKPVAEPKPAAKPAAPTNGAAPAAATTEAGRKLLQGAETEAPGGSDGTPEPVFLYDGTNTAQVIYKDITGGKTVVHIIDRVMVPPAEAKAVTAVVTTPPPALQEVKSSASHIVASAALAAVPLLAAAML
jgi:hypothetical protein